MEYKKADMSDNIKYSYPITLDFFRNVLREGEIAHVAVKDTPRYSIAVSSYLQTINRAREAVENSKLVFKG